jgi:hypothetical protein
MKASALRTRQLHNTRPDVICVAIYGASA